MLPDLQTLQALFIYDRETGRLFWRWHPNPRTRSIVVGAEAGAKNGAGYLVVKFEGKTLLVHRIIFKILHGVDAPRVDHKNRDRSDNVPSNLRAADATTNNWNREVQARKSLPKGVFENRPGKFRARIMVRGERIDLGTFETIGAAEAAYREASIQHFGEFACA